MVDRYADDPLFEPGEVVTVLGTACDGYTTTFAWGVPGPIVPGSVVVRVISASVIDQMARVTDPTVSWASGHDITKDGVLHGQISSGTVNYLTGQVHVDFQAAPPDDYSVEVLYRRFVHTQRGFKVQALNDVGENVWLTLKELAEMLAHRA